VSVASVGDSKIAGEILLNGHPVEPKKQIANITFDNVVIQGRKLTGPQDARVKTNNTPDNELVTHLIFNP
jgi:hypothetical protein